MIIYSGYSSQFQTATDILCMNVDFLQYSSKWRRVYIIYLLINLVKTTRYSFYCNYIKSK